MLKQIVITIFLILLLLTGQVSASYHAEAEAQICNNSAGEVLEKVNNEFFSISICDNIKVFKEFSYCYGVEKGDMVFFDSNPDDCVMNGFTVMRNDVQCGVLCQ